MPKYNLIVFFRSESISSLKYPRGALGFAVFSIVKKKKKKKTGKKQNKKYVSLVKSKIWWVRLKIFFKFLNCLVVNEALNGDIRHTRSLICSVDESTLISATSLFGCKCNSTANFRFLESTIKSNEANALFHVFLRASSL